MKKSMRTGLWSVLLLGLAPPAQAALFGGYADVLQIDYAQHSERKYYAVLDSGERVQLQVPAGQPLPQQSGERLQIDGDILPAPAASSTRQLRVNTLQIVPLARHAGAHTTAVGEPAVDVRSVGVFIINSGNSAAISTRAALESSIFTGSQSSRAYFEYSSWQQLTLNGDQDGDGSADIFAGVTVPAEALSSCDVYAIKSSAETQAQQNGVDLSRYRHRVFALPTDVPCGWGGLANVGCWGSCSAWVVGTSPSLISHELGHTLGMHHSATDAGNDGVIDAEYGDRTDVMGNGYGASNAPHRVQMGWTAIDPAMVSTVSVSGAANLLPLDALPDPAHPAVRIIKIAKPDSGSFYYLALRTAAAPFGVGSAHNNRVSLHTQKGTSQTLFIRSLGTGESFTDSVNRISISVVSSAAQGAELYISLDGSTCVRGTPVLSVPASASATPALATSVTATVGNTDTAACGASQFSLLQTLPGGIGGSLSPEQVTLQPGASASITWALTPALNTLAGNYATTLKVAADANHAEVGAALNLQVSVSDASPPAPVSGLKAARYSSLVELSWLPASDAQSGVSSYLILRDGVQIGSTQDLRFTDSAVTVGTTYAYSVVAVNGALLRSTPVRVSALIPQPGPICFYEHTNYGGASLCVGLGGGNLPSSWQKRISSLRVPSGYGASLFDASSESGNRVSFGRDITSLVSMLFNDKALSWRVIATVANNQAAGQVWRLRTRTAGQYASVADAAGGTAVLMQAWAGQSSQSWTVQIRNDRELRFANGSSGLCLAPKGGSFAPATAITQQSCDSALNKQWYLRALSSGYYEIVNGRSGMCLEVRDGATASGAVVQQNFCTMGSNQRWLLETMP